MTHARPLQATLSLQLPESDPGDPRHLCQALLGSGVEVQVAGPSNLPAIVGFDGKLKPEHGALFRHPGAHFLLALSGEERQPRALDLAVLVGLLQGAPLIPDFEGAERYYVGTLPGLRTASERARTRLEEGGAPRGAAEACADVMYELAANALLDAPVDGAGAPRYAHRRDDPALRISPEDAAVIAFGIKGAHAYLGAVDRFGRLGPEPLARTLEGLGGRAKVNSEGGGAGLGMRRIVEQSDLVAVRVVPGRTTEVLCAVELRDVRRRAQGSKSLFFSVERG